MAVSETFADALSSPHTWGCFYQHAYIRAGWGVFPTHVGVFLALYINSPGGLISAGLAIYDTMQFIACPVATCCMGQAASMAAVLLAAGSPGRRFSLPHSRIIIEQPHGGYAGQASDIQIHAQEITRLKGLLTDILAEHSRMGREELEPMLDRDTFLSPQEALDLGIIDNIIKKR